MGASNQEGQLVPPRDGVKKMNYFCPGCKNPAIFKKGTKKIAHFAHKAKNVCQYYDHPSEGERHKQAKLQLALMIKKHEVPIFVIQKCACHKEEISRIELTAILGDVVVEHPFIHNGRSCRADIAIVDDDSNILYIVEICDTHPTDEDRRPEGWVELKADEVLHKLNEDSDIIELYCSRVITPESCIQKEKKKRELEEEARREREVKQKEYRAAAEAKEKEEREAREAAENRRKAREAEENRRKEAEQSEMDISPCSECKKKDCFKHKGSWMCIDCDNKAFFEEFLEEEELSKICAHCPRLIKSQYTSCFSCSRCKDCGKTPCFKGRCNDCIKTRISSMLDKCCLCYKKINSKYTMCFSCFSSNKKTY